MTGLLVSVCCAQEARAALEGGADLIDVKDPRRGSLGAADPQQWEEVLQVVGQNAPLSVALGELLEKDIANNIERTAGFQYAKVGLAGCLNELDWPQRWAAVLRSLPADVIPVAVCYADWERAQAPRPEEVLDYASTFGCGAFLLDTFSKTEGGLFSHFTAEKLRPLLQEVQRRGMLAVLGGSLGIDCISSAMELQPNYIAVRGAVCRGQRTNRVDISLVRELAQQIATSQRHVV